MKRKIEIIFASHTDQMELIERLMTGAKIEHIGLSVEIPSPAPVTTRLTKAGKEEIVGYHPSQPKFFIEIDEELD